jgi:hypothetical protein
MTSTSYRVTKGTRRSAQLTFLFDDRRLAAHQGETLAAALLANGIRAFRRDGRRAPRGPYCNMGTCFECLVEVRAPTDPGRCDQEPGGRWSVVRACVSFVSSELAVRSVEQLRGSDTVT